MLSGPQAKFVRGIVRGLTQTAAYLAAYPDSAPDSARSNAPRLMANDDVKAEIERLRAKVDEKGGESVLSLLEKRQFCARVVRASVAELPRESDLWQSVKITEDGTEFRLPDKVAMLKLDGDLAGESPESKVPDLLGSILEAVRK